MPHPQVRAGVGGGGGVGGAVGMGGLGTAGREPWRDTMGRGGGYQGGGGWEPGTREHRYRYIYRYIYISLGCEVSIASIAPGPLHDGRADRAKCGLCLHHCRMGQSRQSPSQEASSAPTGYLSQEVVGQAHAHQILDAAGRSGAFRDVAAAAESMFAAHPY